MGSVGDALEQLVAVLRQQPGNRIVLTEADGQTFTSGQLVARADRISEGLGAGKKDPVGRIAVLLEDRLINAFDILAMSSRASVLPLNPDLNDRALGEAIAASGVDCILTERDWFARFEEMCPDVVMCDSIDRVSAPIAASGSFRKGLVLSTSGTTGIPKRVPLTPQQIVGSAKRIAHTLDLSEKDCAISALPVFHIGAIVDLMLAPLLSGGRVMAAKDKTPSGLFGAVKSGGTWLQLVPTMLSRCLAELTDAELLDMGAQLRFVRMVSSDLAPALQETAERAFGGTPLVQIYGMTETAGQITSNPLPPERRIPGSVGIVTSGMVSIRASDGEALPRGETGEICVTGPSVTSGYEGTEVTPRYGEWLRTGDLGHIDKDGYLFLTGRLKEMINRGGEKISPVTVERAALEIEGVVEAVAYAKPHPTLGEQVGLAVVAPGLDETKILAAMRKKLAEFECPRNVVFLNELPRLGSGKVDRKMIADRLISLAPEIDFPLDTPLVAQVAKIWSAVLGHPVTHWQEDFFDAGGDSLSATEFLFELEQQFGFQVPGNVLFEKPRFGNLVEELNKLGAVKKRVLETVPSSISFVRNASAIWPGKRVGQNKICIEHNSEIGGAPLVFSVNNALVYDSFTKTIGKDRRCLLLRSLVGWHGRRGIARHEVATAAADDLQELVPDGPLLLGGLCEGAEIMERVAEILIRQGRKVALFVAADHEFAYPPEYPVVNIWTDSRFYSPYGRFIQPERTLALQYPAGAVVHHFKGNHGSALTEPALQRLKPELERYIQGEQLTPARLDDGLSMKQRRRRWSSRISAQVPRVLQQDTEVNVTVRVKNTSPDTWPKTSDSGLFVSAALVGWRRLRFDPSYPWYKRILGQRIKPQILEEPMTSGESRDFVFRVRVPRKRGLYFLRVSMADDGVGHFVDGWKRGKYIPVVIR